MSHDELKLHMLGRAARQRLLDKFISPERIEEQLLKPGRIRKMILKVLHDKGYSPEDSVKIVGYACL